MDEHARLSLQALFTFEFWLAGWVIAFAVLLALIAGLVSGIVWVWRRSRKQP